MTHRGASPLAAPSASASSVYKLASRTILARDNAKLNISVSNDTAIEISTEPAC